MTSQLSTRRAHARSIGFLAAGLVLLAGALAGCDSSSDDADTSPGTFAATTDGDTPTAFQGWSAFDDNLDIETGERAFGVGLVTRDSANTFVFVGRGAPTARAYTLTADDPDGEAAAFFFRAAGEEGGLYLATTGSLTLTSVAAHRMAGRFQFTAVSIIDETDRVTFSGTFDAPRGEVSSDPVEG